MTVNRLVRKRTFASVSTKLDVLGIVHNYIFVDCSTWLRKGSFANIIAHCAIPFQIFFINNNLTSFTVAEKKIRKIINHTNINW